MDDTTPRPGLTRSFDAARYRVLAEGEVSGPHPGRGNSSGETSAFRLRRDLRRRILHAL